MAKAKKTSAPSPKTKPAARKPKATPAKTKKKTALLKRTMGPSFVEPLAVRSSGPLLPLRLQAVVDKSELTDLLYSAARGLDRIDETLLRSVFHPDATVDLGPGVFQGTSGDYVHWVVGVLTQIRESHHLIGNVRVTLEGDAAFVESYCHAHFRLDKPTGREDVFIGSRFLDRAERRPSGAAGVWKLVHRKQVIDWVRTEAVSDLFYHQNPDALWSYRTKTDLSYQMAQFPGSHGGSKMPSFLGRRYESKSVRF